MQSLIQWWQSLYQAAAWEWISNIVIFMGMGVIVWVIWRVVMSRLKTLAERTQTRWDDVLWPAIDTPFSLFIWGWPVLHALEIFLDNTAGHLDLSWVSVIREVLIVFLLIWFLLRLVNSGEQLLFDEGRRDHTTINAIGNVLRSLAVCMGVITLLQSLGVSVSGLLTVGGMGGLIVGFAAKDLLSNFFGGVMIYFDRPFKVGDWIRSPDRNIEGSVEKIGIRMTVVRTFDLRPLYIPNSVFSNVVVENPSRMLNRRIYETIGLRYQDADKLGAVIDGVYAMLEAHSDIETRQTLIVNFNSFGPHSLDFFIYTFTKTVNWQRYHQVKQDVLLKVIKIIHQHGADIAFPTRTLHMDQSMIEQGAAAMRPSPEA
ncbi:mechanosensitive ion channel family protein [Salinivibrio socompensis]|uniref:mechanosensitive ion channel family protein n=1 Tax=Salinivibrio socompensis TaxID=1510206 RepID=UPI00046EF33B|nr:mechanosensitive ion channel family protein [Salinivibrio socompensis]